MNEHDQIVRGFVDWVQREKRLDLETGVAEKAMYEFMEANIYRIIKSQLLKTALDPEISGGDLQLLFGRYIKSCVASSDQVVLSYLSDISKGLMISSVLYLPNVETIERRFVDTFLVLDSPILLAALGYVGEDIKAPILELLNLATSNGAKLACLEFTLSETVSVLDACAQRVRSGARITYGKTVEYFIEQKLNYDEIMVLKNRLPSDVKKLGIEIREKPEYTPAYMIDEAKLEDIVKQRVSYRYESSRRRDVDAVSAVFRMRKGRNDGFLEESKGIFVTTNYALVMAAKEYFNTSYGHLGTDIAMTDFFLTNILWLKKPTKYPELPLKRAIADVISATQPSDKLWYDFMSEAENLEKMGTITYDDVVVLRSSSEVPDLLMDSTHGGMSALSPSTIKDILGQIQHDREKEFDRKQDERLLAKAKIGAKLVANFVYVVVAMLLVLGTALSLSDLLRSRFGSWAGIVVTCLLFILAVFSILHLLIGTTVNGLKKLLLKILQRRIYDLLRKLLK
jgi:hypothetical protein